MFLPISRTLAPFAKLGLGDGREAQHRGLVPELPADCPLDPLVARQPHRSAHGVDRLDLTAVEPDRHPHLIVGMPPALKG